MTNASDTPKTDVEEAKKLGGWSFARTLERELAAKSAEVERLRAALRTIERWEDFPETGRFWDEAKTRPTSYATEFGFLGAIDYMRSIAREALEAK